ncbi:hypothetical protein ACNPPY_08415 [Achromobacter sp. AGC78]
MMDRLRMSALALHAVADRDRAWLLSRLPEAQRKQLAALVDELRVTGMPADPEIVQQLVREQEVLARSPVAGALVERLLRADAEDVWTLLRGESDAVLCRIIRLHDWPWRPALRELCGPVRAKRIDNLATQLPVAEALEQALIGELDRRLSLRQSTYPRVPQTRWRFGRRARRST